MTSSLRRTASRWFLWLTLAVVAGCGGGGDANPTYAKQSDLAVSGHRTGKTPFIAWVDLSGRSATLLSSLRYVIQGKPGHVSKPVTVTYSVPALVRKGYYATGARALTLPVFGLYADFDNQVSIDLHFTDGSTQTLALSLQTPAYVDATGVYAQPTVLKARPASAVLDFDFVLLKSAVTGPVIIDTDGEMRWVGETSAFSMTFVDNGFVTGAKSPPTIIRQELDGTTTETPVAESTFTAFHHNIDPGKVGLLGEFNANSAGLINVESVLAEFTTTGAVLKQWDFAAILSSYMQSQGDDPTQFIRYGEDWFHMNAAAYDPSDDSIIASSRENFVIKVDYATGAIKWIFGDPTKYWHSFPSLRGKALTLPPGGLYPIGQHSVSVTSDAGLMLFDNGKASVQQPPGAPSGEERAYSSAVKFSVDTSTLSAQQTWRYDHDQSIKSDICSSAYEVGGSILLNYAFADAGAHARIIALDAARQVALDLQYNSPAPCAASWNAIPVALEGLAFQ